MVTEAHMDGPPVQPSGSGQQVLWRASCECGHGGGGMNPHLMRVCNEALRPLIIF